MATRPELHVAIAKTKNKASEYNENFEMMMQYVDDSIQEAETYVDGFMPDQTGNSGRFLKTNGTTASWFNLLGANNTFSGTNKFTGTTSITNAGSLSCAAAATFTGTTKVPASTTSGTALQLSSQNKSSSGYIKLGSGIIIQWGTRNADGAVSVSLPTAFSSGSSYGVTVSPVYNSNTLLYAVSVKSKSSSSFSYYAQGAVSGVTWLAIGY